MPKYQVGDVIRDPYLHAGGHNGEWAIVASDVPSAVAELYAVEKAREAVVVERGSCSVWDLYAKKVHLSWDANIAVVVYAADAVTAIYFDGKHYYLITRRPL